jgi:hypothetical protein
MRSEPRSGRVPHGGRRNSFRVAIDKKRCPVPGLPKRNPGLELTNAFGVEIASQVGYRSIVATASQGESAILSRGNGIPARPSNPFLFRRQFNYCLQLHHLQSWGLFRRRIRGKNHASIGRLAYLLSTRVQGNHAPVQPTAGHSLAQPRRRAISSRA